MVPYLSLMAVKPRQRGERDEEGATKTAILLFLAGHGVQTFTDIRLYLREKCNIRSPKNLRIHLAGLVKTGLITRCLTGPGKADTYKVESSYKGIKALFGFFQALGREREIMATRHFRSYTGSQDFQQKVILSIIRACILRIDEKAVSPHWQEWMTAQTGHVQESECRLVWDWIRQVRSGDMSSVYCRNFRDLLERYATEDIDAIHSMFFRLLAEYQAVEPQYRSGEYLIMVNEFILPTTYRELAFAMVLNSPSACDYILNKMQKNPLFPSPKLMGQVLEFLALFPEVYDFTIAKGGDTEYLKAIEQSRRQQFMERVDTFSGEPSTYMMIKSLFVHDLVYGKLAEGEIPEEVSRQIIE